MMSVNDMLGKRMKENYEMRARSYLIRRMPNIKYFKKNFLDIIIKSLIKNF